MKSFSYDQIELLAEAAEDLIKLHLGKDTVFLLVVRQGDRVNCICNAPPETGEELKAIFAELSERAIKPIPTHEGDSD